MCVVWCPTHVWNVMVEALLTVRGCVCRVVSDARVECDGGDVVAMSSGKN